MAFADSAEMARQLVRLYKLAMHVESRRHEKAMCEVLDYNSLSISCAVYRPWDVKFAVRPMKQKYRHLVPHTFREKCDVVYFFERALLRKLISLMDLNRVPRWWLACLAHNFAGHGYGSQYLDKVKQIVAGGEDFDTVWPEK